ncbi:c-type cytochrome [Novosphingobium sp. P6W]|uniref:c-type cytochrome n=1 Tax=Novosphingobium sp. P6W TaxID=1609758 RepID=UPI0005C2C646|nr:c-type cytochrome [Novosphingobium sp. P6W]AXB75989.1 cytochrome C [Novosphingobium sp. P6W]KIS31187.1 cytochrome C [Novosphingobium sp. P6W]
MTVKITWKRALAALALLGALGMGFAWSGLFPLAASSGHWKITDWFLHWTMQNSVRTYSTFQTPGKVRDDTGLVSAAGHFRQACQVCHGAPGALPSPAMQAATPHAPDLAKTAAHYTDRELFWIVRHGVKYTGMPAWPAADRPDEVARMVGFLRRLPGMSAQQYAALSSPPALTGKTAAAQCMGCHGSDGMGRGQKDIPVIAGQKTEVLVAALRRYAAGQRESAVMQVAAASLSKSEMQDAAEYFSALPGLADIALPGKHPLPINGRPLAQLPACTGCHAPGKTAPLIAGQRASYLAARLRQWRGEDTVIDAHKPQDAMAVIARRIPEDEIDRLAAALAGSPPP